jgi:hypothetical protein
VKRGGWTIPGEVPLFSNAEKDEAVRWVSVDTGQEPASP